VTEKKDNEEGIIHLSGKEKKTLRGIAHKLEPAVYVGKEGFSKSLLASVREALAARELIKIKLGSNCPVEKKEAANLLAGQTGSALVQLIGKTVILYCPNTDLDKEKRVII
jgi:RNA-binding protein